MAKKTKQDSPGIHQEKIFWGKKLEIAQDEVPCEFLEGVADCTLLIREHQAFSGVWLKLALSLLSY